MNTIINQRFVVAFYSEDGGHCDTEFLSRRQEAIDYAKRYISKQFEKFKVVMYAEINDYMHPKAAPIKIELE